MKKYQITLVLLALTLLAPVLPAGAQTAYYTNLLTQLAVQNGLTGGAWNLPADEQTLLNGAIVYGNTASNLNISGEAFSRARQLQVPAAGANPWDAGFFVSNTQAIAQGDRLLLFVWVRSATATAGKANLFIEQADTYDKEVYYPYNVPTTWTRLVFRFEAGQNYPVGKMHLGFHIGHLAQTLQVGGIALRNYAGAYPLAQLPIELHQDYAGSAPDAPWRAEAASRIEQLRKANLSVVVRDANGKPVPGAIVRVDMLDHAFKFGSAITAKRIAGNHGQNNLYQQRILDFDGQGHGFNEVVFENDLKWDAWTEQWDASPAEIVNAVHWLRERGISVRGHNLVWPGWQYLPNDLEANQLNRAYLRSRLDARIEEMLHYPGLAGQIAEWDVLNEITANNDLANAFAGAPGYPTGREIYVDILNKVKAEDPAMPAYLNDYVTLDLGNAPGSPVYEQCKQYVQEIATAGASVQGLGFQAHIGAGLVSMYDIQAILDDFYAGFGYRAKLTEFDLSDLLSDSLSVRFTRDLLTMAFSHASVDGFLSWGFWDGAHWHDNAPFFRDDWTMKPAGQAVADLLFRAWWTRDSLLTDAGGQAALRGFKGRYRVRVECNGALVASDTLQLTEDLQRTYTCGALAAAEPAGPGFQVAYANPARAGSRLTLRCSAAPRQLRLSAADGRLLHRMQPEQNTFDLALPDAPGVYFLQLTLPAGGWAGRVVVE